MTIKKTSTNQVSIDTQSITVKVSFLDAIKVNIGETTFDKPGEYEINNISITALEIPNPDYVAVNDFVAIRSENIDLGFAFTDKATNKDFLKDVANIDVLVLASNLNPENVKKILTFFEPQYLIVLGDKNNEEVKKNYNLPNITEEKTIKVKESDFPRGENIVLRPIILK